MLPNIEFHAASDRRCYNGAASNDLNKEWASIAEAKALLKKASLNITYFPYGEYYVGFKLHVEKAPEVLTEDCSSFESCYTKLVKLTEVKKKESLQGS